MDISVYMANVNAILTKMTQAEILSNLEKLNRPITVKEYCQIFKITKGTVERAFLKLVRANFLKSDIIFVNNTKHKAKIYTIV